MMTGALQDGYFVEPTVFAEAHDEMRITREEISGQSSRPYLFTMSTKSYSVGTERRSA